MKIIFDVKHLYYLPQYLPVYHQLVSKDIDCIFVFYHSADNKLNSTCERIIENEKIPSQWHDSWNSALNYYLQQKANWIIFGNAAADIETIHKVSKTALMQHGIGPKSCYYHVSNNQTTVRFVEGEHRLKRLQQNYPGGSFVDTGYAKLDPLFDGSQTKITLNELGLDPNRKTVLYAPTFYPSSIECFSDDFAKHFQDYNIIVKPHFFSLTKKKYIKHFNKIESWRANSNVYLAPVECYNILPYMQISNILISDVSSVMFEFAAMDKPVVWCDFYKVKWSDRGVFKFRLNKRLDPDIAFFHQISDRVTGYTQLLATVNKVLRKPKERSIKRLEIIKELAGITDGHCSERIANYLINEPDKLKGIKT